MEQVKSFVDYTCKIKEKSNRIIRELKQVQEEKDMLEKQCKKQKIENERLLRRMNNAERNANLKNLKREMNKKER